MPYAYGATINHVFDTDHLEIYATFRHPMNQTVKPPLELWLLEADEVSVDIINSDWLDEHTLRMTSDTVASEPTGVTLEYNGPNENLKTTWDKQWEPWGPLPSYPGYPTTPALHNSTHENGGSDEIQVDGLSGRLADTQRSFVHRGDPAAGDFNTADFISDGAAHDLDLSSIVPEGAKAVLLCALGMSTALDRTLLFRKKGNVNWYNAGELRCQVANKYIGFTFTVALDENRKCQYWADSNPWAMIRVTVAGWFF